MSWRRGDSGESGGWETVGRVVDGDSGESGGGGTVGRVVDQNVKHLLKIFYSCNIIKQNCEVK